jgi:hypothetical protein
VERARTDPQDWEAITREAKAQLPALLQGKESHVAYTPTLQDKIRRIVARRAGIAFASEEQEN